MTDWLELPPFTPETLWGILNDDIDDGTVNRLLWHALGYRWDAMASQWDGAGVAPEWLAEYPDPPDFIGSRAATVKLTRSIPKEHKQLLKEVLGFEGYRVGELTPRKTRRATAVNWLLGWMQSLPRDDN